MSAEAATRAQQILAEHDARVQALLDEAGARAAGLLAEQNARAAVILAEAAARGTDITNVNTLRQQGDDQLASSIASLTATVNTNQSAATAAVQDEATARASADAAEASQRTILAARVTGAEGAINANTASIVAEAAASANRDAAEAAARNLLAAQMRGSSTGTDINALTEGLLYQERVARATNDAALSQQITLLSAGAGEQFDYSEIWYFDSGAEGWTGNGTPTAANGFLRPANVNDPGVVSPTGLAVEAAKYGQLRLRVRKTGTPEWAGNLSGTRRLTRSFQKPA
ncbi:hypothetical protein LP414_27865 [Polaromonas sp. P1(28)-13]|nr:hypothetical protein LP414_27865 [Polaromonas sp. P1(28)-13]